MIKQKRTKQEPVRSRKQRRKSYKFLDEGGAIDYKDVQFLEQFITERGRIVPRRITGLTAKQQRHIALAIKRARIMALIPFSATQQR